MVLSNYQNYMNSQFHKFLKVPQTIIKKKVQNHTSQSWWNLRKKKLNSWHPLVHCAALG